MYGSFWYNVCIKAVAQIDRIDVITTLPDQRVVQNDSTARVRTYHSKSLYIMVKKTCRKRLTALISTASRYSHASPDIIVDVCCRPNYLEGLSGNLPHDKRPSSHGHRN